MYKKFTSLSSPFLFLSVSFSLCISRHAYSLFTNSSLCPLENLQKSLSYTHNKAVRVGVGEKKTWRLFSKIGPENYISQYLHMSNDYTGIAEPQKMFLSVRDISHTFLANIKCFEVAIITRCIVYRYYTS